MGGMRIHSFGMHFLMTVFREAIHTAHMITTTHGDAMVTTPIEAIKNTPISPVMPMAEKRLICR
jgi:hypothetical protein